MRHDGFFCGTHIKSANEQINLSTNRSSLLGGAATPFGMVEELDPLTSIFFRLSFRLETCVNRPPDVSALEVGAVDAASAAPGPSAAAAVAGGAVAAAASAAAAAGSAERLAVLVVVEIQRPRQPRWLQFLAPWVGPAVPAFPVSGPAYHLHDTELCRHHRHVGLLRRDLGNVSQVQGVAPRQHNALSVTHLQ